MRSTRLRHRLILSTTLGTGLFLAASPVGAQTSLPTPADATNLVNVNAPVLSPDGTRLDIDVTANGGMIDWKRFDIPANNTIQFNDQTGGNGASRVAVLNRVIGDSGTITPSTIDGLLKAPANMAVYLLNPAGLTFGAGAVVDVGSLIAGTLDLSRTDFLAGLASGTERFASTTPGTVQVDTGARLFATGSAAAGLGNLVLLGTKISVTAPAASGTPARIVARQGADPLADPLIAPGTDDGDVAFVAADDVTITTSAGSPLAITIAKGTAVTGAFKVDGTIAGRNVTLALATRGTVADTLLSVGGMTTATGAAVTDRGVVLTADRAVPGAVTLLPDPASPTNLTDIGTTGGITTTATIGSGGTVTIGATSTLTLGGSIAAQNKVDLTTTTGDIRSAGALTLRSNSGNVAYDATTPVDRGLYLDAVAGAIDLTGSTLTTGTVPADAYAVQIRNDTANPLAIRGMTLGDVTAFGITVTDVAHTPARATTLDVTGGLTLGTATLSGATITATGAIAVTRFDSDNAVSLTSSTAGVTLGALRARSGNGSIVAATSAAVTGAVDVGVDAAGDYIVTGGTVTLGATGASLTQKARGAVTITATEGDLTGSSGLTLRSDDLGGTGAALTLAATGSTAGEIAFGGTSLATSSTTDRAAVRIRSHDASRGVTLGTVNAGSLLGAIADAPFTTGIVRSTAITVGDVTLTGAPTGADPTLRLDAGTAALVTSTLSAPTIVLNAGDMTLGGITGTGAVTLTGSGTFSTGTITSVSGLTIDRGGSVTLGDVTIGGDLLVGQTPGTQPDTITTTGTLTTTGSGNLRLAASGAVEVRGAASVAGAYAVTGGSVTLGTANTAITQTASGTVSVEATDGNVTGQARLLLRSDRNGVGNTPLTIATSRAGGARIDFTGATLWGGAATRSAVQIAPGSAANIVTLGDVTASTLQGDIVGGTYADTITRAATLTFGTFDLTTALTATSTAGDIRLGGATIGTGQGITLSAANGALFLPTALSAPGSITLTTGAALTTGSVTSTGGAVNVTTGGNALTATTLSGATGLTIAAGGGAVTLGSGAAGSGALSITSGTLDNGLNQTALSTTGAMTLTLSGAGRLGTLTAGSIDVTAALIELASATAPGSIALTTGGALNFGTVSAGDVAAGTGTASLTADGALTGTFASGVGGITAQGLNAEVGRLVSDAGGVSLTTTGGDTRLGSATTRTGVAIGATGGAARVTGAVEAGGNYTVSGTGVTLGNGAATVLQSANGAVSVTATNATLAAGSGLTLRANADASGAEALTLVTTGATGGDIAFAGGLQAGPTIVAGSMLTVRSRSAANAVTLGDIVAQRLTGAAGGVPDATGLTRNAAIRTGAVMLGQSLVLTGITIDTGAASASVIDLSAQGALTAASLTATGGAVILSGTGATNVTGGVATTGVSSDIRIDRTGAMQFGSLNATQDLLIGQATTLTVTGTTSAGQDVSIDSSDTQTFTGAVTAGRDLTLTGRELVLNGATATTGALTLTATTSDLTVSTLNAGIGATLVAGGAARVTGAVDLAGDYNVTGGSVILGNAGTTLTHRARGSVAITATAGALSGLAGLTLQSDDAGTTGGALRLTTTRAGDAIAFGGTKLIAGNGVARPAVQIRSASAGSAVTLGTVRAGQLLGAVAGDPYTTGLTRSAAITVGDVTLAGGPAGVDATLRLDAGSAALTTGTLSAPTIALNAGDITLGGITGTGTATLTGSGALTAGGIAGLSALTIDRAGSVTLSTATAGTIQVGQTVRPTTITTTGALSTAGAIRLASSSTQNFAGAITAGSDATISSGGSLTLGMLNATGTATLNSLGLTATSLTAGSLTATSTGSNGLTIGALATNNGGATISGAGSVSIGGTASIAGDYRVNGTTVTLGGISRAGAIVLTGTGALTAGAMKGIASLSVDRGGSVALTSVSASGDILIGQTVRPATITTTGTLVTGSAIRLASSGAQTLRGTIGANGAVTLTGGSIAAGAITSTTGAIGVSATGTVQLGSATSAGDTVITAGDLARVTGNVDSGADYRVTGSGVILGDGGTVVTQGARGSVRLLSTVGTIAGGSGLTLQGDRAGTGAGTLVLDSAGGIALDPATVLFGGIGIGTGDIGLRTGNGAGITLGIVTARRLTGADTAGALTATLLASGTLDLAGTVTTTATLNASAAGTITARRIDVTGTGGDLILSGTGPTADLLARGPLTATREIGLTANRDLGFTTVTAGRAAGATATTGTLTGTTLTGATTARAVAAGSLSLTTLTGQTGAEARGATVTLTDAGTANGLLTLTATLGGLTATSATSTRGAVALSAAGDIALGSASADDDLTISDARDVGGIAPATRTTLSAGRDIVASARGTMRGATFTAGRDLTLTASALDLLTGSVTGGSATISAGSAAIATLTGRNATITTTGDAVLGRIDTSGNGGSGDLAISASGRVDGGSGIRSILTAGRNLTLSAGGAALLGPVAAGGQATLSTASLDLSTLSAASATIATTAGDAVTGTLTTSGALAYDAATTARIGAINAGGAITVAGSAVDLGIVRGRAGFAASSRLSTLGVVDLSTSGNIIVRAATDALLRQIASTGGGLDITAGGTLGATSLIASGAIAAQGTSVTIGRTTGATTVALTATSGDLTLTDTSGASGVNLIAAQDLHAATVTARGTGADLSITAGGLIDGGSGIRSVLTAGRNLALTAGGVALLGPVGVGGQATLRSASLDLSTLTANTASITATNGDAIAGTLMFVAALDYTASGTARISTANVGGLATITGGAVDLSTLTAKAASITATNGDALAGSLTTIGTLGYSASGLARIGKIDSGGFVTVAGGTVDLGMVRGRDGFRAISRTGTLAIVDLSASRDVFLNVGTDAWLGLIASTGGGIDITAGGLLQAAGLTATGAIAARGASATIGRTTGATTVVLTTTIGDLTLNDTSGTTGVSLIAAQDLHAATVTASGTGADLSITAGGLIDGGDGIRSTLTAGRNLTLAAGGVALLGPVGVGGQATLRTASLDLSTVTANTASITATGGDAVSGTLTIAGALDYTASGIARIGTTNATGLATITGGTVDLSTFTANTALINATAGDAITGSLTTTGALAYTASGTAHIDTASVGGLATIAGGIVNLSTLSANAALITATTGNAVAGSLTTTGTLGYNAAATARIGTIDAGDAVTIAGSAVDLGTVRGRGAVSATSQVLTLDIADLSTSRNVTLRAATDAVLGRIASTGGGIDIVAGRALGATSLTALTTIAGAGATATIGSTNAADIAFTTLNGALAVANLTARNGATLIQRGTGGLNVTGSVTTGADAMLTADGTITAPTIIAERDLQLTVGTTLTAPLLTAGRDLRATTGDAARLAVLTAGRAITVTAGGATEVTGAVTASSYALQGSTVTLGTTGLNVTQQASGSINLRATQGAVTGVRELTLIADDDGDGAGDLTLRATAGIDFASGTNMLAGRDGTSAIRFAPGPGRALTLDVVRARTLLSYDDAASATRFAHDGAVSIADLSVRDATTIGLTGTVTPLTLGTARAHGDLTLTTTGALAATTLNVTGALTARGGSVALVATDARSADIASTAGALDLTRLTVQRAASLDATGTLGFDTITTGGSLGLSATGDVLGQGAATLTSTGGLVTITTREAGDGGGTVRLATITAASDLAVTGRQITLTNATATGGSATLTARGNDAGATAAALTIDRVTAGRGIALSATRATGAPASASNGPLLLGRAQARDGDLRLVADGNLAAPGGSAGTTLIATGTVAATVGRTALIDTAEAGGDLTLTAGDLRLTTGTATGATRLIASGTATISALTATTIDAATRGGTLTVTTARAGSVLTLNAMGDLQLTEGIAGGTATLTSTGTARVAQLQAQDAGITGATLALDRVSTTAALTASAGTGDAALGTIAVGTVAAFTSGGALTATSLTAGTAVRLTVAGDARIDALTAGQDVTFTGQGNAQFGTLASTAGAATLTTARELTATTLTTARALGITARTATIGSATAGDDFTATASAGDLSLGTLNAASGTITASGTATLGGAVTVAGNQTVRANAVTLGASGATVAQRAGTIALTATGGAITGRGALALTAGTGGMTLTATGSGGTIDLASTSTLDSGGALGLETTGLATIGTVTNTGRTVTVSAADVALNGAITAGTIVLTNRTPANLTRLGTSPTDNATEFASGSNTRFDLSTAEISRLATANLVIDAQSGAVTIGDVALGTGTGSAAFQIRTSGRLDVLGRFVAIGSSPTRSIALGGGANTDTRAGVLRVATTAGGGGRLLVDGGTLDLRADAIGVGIDQGFLDTLGVTPGGVTPGSGTPATDVAIRYAAQSNSTLYNAALLSPLGFYTDPVTVQAGRMIVRYAGFALFQNTGASGLTSGVVLGSDGQTQTLQLLAAGLGGSPVNGFALFGTINGIAGTATSLLGGSTLLLNDQVSRADSRANGCLIGSVGGGCLSASLAQPTLNIFDSSRLDVFRTSDDLTLPLDPLISTSNEALFSDIATLGADVGLLNADTPCPPDDKTCATTGQR